MSRSLRVVIDLTIWDEKLSDDEVGEGLFDSLHAAGDVGLIGHDLSVDGWEIDRG